MRISIFFLTHVLQATDTSIYIDTSSPRISHNFFLSVFPVFPLETRVKTKHTFVQFLSERKVRMSTILFAIQRDRHGSVWLPLYLLLPSIARSNILLSPLSDPSSIDSEEFSDVPVVFRCLCVFYHDKAIECKGIF